jgi:hypothetical protein
LTDHAAATLTLVLDAFRAALGHDLAPSDDFFESGGDSVASEAVLMRLEEATGLTLPGWTLLDHTTAERVAAYLDEERPASP